MNGLLQDLRYGLRQLRGNPGFTATVVLTLALAIGANTAIFSIVNALMLRSLPYSHPDRIGTIFTRIRGPVVSDERHHISGEQWELLRDNVPALISALSGIRPSGVNLDADSHVQYADEQMLYVPAAQMESRQLSLIHIWFQPSWINRTSRPIEGLTAQMQRALASVDSDLPFSGFYRMNDLLAKTLATERVEVALLTTMAVLALILSAVGIFALVANIVTQKTREIGIRIALGSTIREAMVHIGVPGLQASALGLIVGLILCAGALRVMRTVLYGIGVYDIPTMISVVMALASVTLIAAAMPTLRIARIDPAETLREE